MKKYVVTKDIKLSKWDVIDESEIPNIQEYIEVCKLKDFIWYCVRSLDSTLWDMYFKDADYIVWRISEKLKKYFNL